jgi:hypothetical protein
MAVVARGKDHPEPESNGQAGDNSGPDVSHGTGNPDTMNGGPDADVLLGKGGRDTLGGGNDSDFIEGGEGDDRLFGGDADEPSSFVQAMRKARTLATRRRLEGLEATRRSSITMCGITSAVLTLRS